MSPSDSQTDTKRDNFIESVHLFDIELEAAPRIDLGETPAGRRFLIPVTGGTFAGRKISGKALNGEDRMMVRNDGSHSLDVRVTLMTDDDCPILMSYSGARNGDPEVMRKLAAGEDVGDATYYFRIAPQFETGYTGNAEKYAWLNGILCIGYGKRLEKTVLYSIHQVL
jgi:hypothetical protein